MPNRVNKPDTTNPFSNPCYAPLSLALWSSSNRNLLPSSSRFLYFFLSVDNLFPDGYFAIAFLRPPHAHRRTTMTTPRPVDFDYRTDLRWIPSGLKKHRLYSALKLEKKQAALFHTDSSTQRRHIAAIARPRRPNVEGMDSEHAQLESRARERVVEGLREENRRKGGRPMRLEPRCGSDRHLDAEVRGGQPQLGSCFVTKSRGLLPAAALTPQQSLDALLRQRRQQLLAEQGKRRPAGRRRGRVRKASVVDGVRPRRIGGGGEAEEVRTRKVDRSWNDFLDCDAWGYAMDGEGGGGGSGYGSGVSFAADANMTQNINEDDNVLKNGEAKHALLSSTLHTLNERMSTTLSRIKGQEERQQQVLVGRRQRGAKAHMKAKSLNVPSFKNHPTYRRTQLAEQRKRDALRQVAEGAVERERVDQEMREKKREERALEKLECEVMLELSLLGTSGGATASGGDAGGTAGVPFAFSRRRPSTAPSVGVVGDAGGRGGHWTKGVGGSRGGRGKLSTSVRDDNCSSHTIRRRSRTSRRGLVVGSTIGSTTSPSVYGVNLLRREMGGDY